MFSKVCDAADWFDPALARAIRVDLEELPRFHRKQWEFAIILRALESHGLLDGGSLGLSMGGGRERLLYAVARRVRRLTVTDLYAPETRWEDARTPDPNAFVKAHKPFPVDDGRILALRMDMRRLEFEDESFDFCYSACAIEHIGAHDDFLGHLNEAHRVLRDGGLYVLTTEFHYGPETVRQPQNYLFCAEDLAALVAETRFTPEPVFEAGLAAHQANLPWPPHPGDLCFDAAGGLGSALLKDFTHLQLLRGNLPFTSAALVLVKDERVAHPARLRFRGLDESREFLARGIAAYRELLERSPLRLDPAAFLPGGVAPWLREHSPAPPALSPDPEDPTVFHTDYVWLGSGRRIVGVSWAGVDPPSSGCRLELRVHAYPNRDPAEVRCVLSETVPIASGSPATHEFAVDAREEDSYSVLGRLIDGRCRFERLAVECSPAGLPVP